MKHVSHDPKRGFIRVERPGQCAVYVRKGFHLVPCPGDAHGPNGAYIDNCMLCAPLWGDIAIPTWARDLDHYRDAAAAVRALTRWLAPRRDADSNIPVPRLPA